MRFTYTRLLHVCIGPCAAFIVELLHSFVTEKKANCPVLILGWKTGHGKTLLFLVGIFKLYSNQGKGTRSSQKPGLH